MMKKYSPKKKGMILLLTGITALVMLIGLLLEPIPQKQSYHHFADKRAWFGIMNTLDVLSNIPLAMVGVWGLFLLFSPGKVLFIHRAERWPWVAIAVGLMLTAFGSAYYHLAPDNARLVWDRLPMTIVFMSFIVAMINDRISVRLGLWLWPILLCIGFYSVFQWQASELRGNGDLRLYAIVQGYAVLLASIISLIPSRYTRGKDLILVVVFYILAKLFELFDHQIYLFDHSMMSGHTLKHLAAAMAGIWLLRMLWRRKIVSHD